MTDSVQEFNDLASNLKLQQEIARRLDDGQLLEKIEKCARAVVKARIKKTQIQQLHNTAQAARGYSEVYNLIMRQMAKERGWEQGWSQDLLYLLTNLVENGEQGLVEGDDLKSRVMRQQACLKLVRGAVGHLLAYFSFFEAQKKPSHQKGGKRQ